MKIEIHGSEDWEHTPVPSDFDAFHDSLETAYSEDVLKGLQALGRSRAEHLLRCHVDRAVPPEERKQALFDYLIVPLAEEPLNRSEKYVHNPALPAWLSLAQSRMAEFIMEDIDTRQILADISLFNDDIKLQRRLANDVSAYVFPKGTYKETAFAAGVLTGQVRARALPPLRADELVLAAGS